MAKVGDKVPSATLRMLGPEGPKAVTTEELFAPGDKVMMLGDGNGEFTQAMGLTMDGSKFGLGTRSQRYAMIVDNGVIKELFVEKPGAFEVSAAENVLKHL